MEQGAHARAALSRGSSSDAVHTAVRRVVQQLGARKGRLVDIGCGEGSLSETLAGHYTRYVGCDLVRYPKFPHDTESIEFAEMDLNLYPLPLDDASANVVVSVETIEHLENPRGFVRELVRVAKPGAWVVITTPNQLSLLSKITLVVKNQFNAFQDGSYPAHITALLEEDLRRIASECGLSDISIHYTEQGRVPFTEWHWPVGLRGRAFSDNVLLVGRRPT